MRKLLLLFLLSIPFFTQAQTTKLNVSESKEYKDKVRSIDVIAIHTSTTETVIVRNAKRDFLFDIFDASLDKTFTKVVERDKKEKYVGDLFYENQLKLFSVYSPKKDERILYCYTLDLATHSYKKTIVFETTVEKKQNLFGSRKNHNTSFSLSPDHNFYAFATDNMRKNKNSYTIRVFDAKTDELIYEKAYQEDEEHSFKHNDLYIDNNAQVYSLGKIYLNGEYNKKNNGDANYQFVLNKVTKDEITKELIVDLEDEHIQSLNISLIDNKLHLIGFYSEKNASKIKGGCDFVVDTNNFSLLSKKAQPLPKQVYEDLYGYRRAKRKNKKKKELKFFDIDFVMTDSQGSTYLIAEEFYITQQLVQNGTNMGSYMQTVYHYDDILILKFNVNGELAWGRSIFKRAGAPSYNAFLKNNQLHIILNSGKNLTEKKDGRTKVSTGFLESTSLYDIEFNVNGEVTYNKIQDNKGNTFYQPFNGTYESDRFIMMSTGGRKKSFMILE